MEFETHLDKDCGYISIGFGEDMDGHDMWVWERDEDRFGNPIGTIRDLWSASEVTPNDDDSQDWSLESHETAQLEDGTEYDIFISRRKVDTGDRRDEVLLFVRFSNSIGQGVRLLVCVRRREVQEANQLRVLRPLRRLCYLRCFFRRRETAGYSSLPVARYHHVRLLGRFPHSTSRFCQIPEAVLVS